MTEAKKTSLALTSKVSLTSENYARIAEQIVRANKEKGREGWFEGLSTTKIRNMYSLVMNVYTRITDKESFEANKGDLQYIKVKMAYESGREKVVKNFIQGTGLMSAIDNISTYDQFLLYCRYAESLVAYFKFYGGEE